MVGAPSSAERGQGSGDQGPAQGRSQAPHARPPVRQRAPNPLKILRGAGQGVEVDPLVPTGVHALITRPGVVRDSARDRGTKRQNALTWGSKRDVSKNDL